MNTATEKYWSTLPLGPGVTLIVRDPNGLVAFAKPAGVLSHPNVAGDEPRSLLDARYALEGEFFEWNTADGTVERLWLLNRIDSATSGVILASADGDLATEVKAQFKRKLVRKVYHALVFGRPKSVVELWRDTLTVEKRAGQIRTAAGAGHVSAECRTSIVKINRTEPHLTLVRLEPRTGRSHQLRVQCAKRKLPIVGDQTYGDFRRNREWAKTSGHKRMFLHSLETSFEYEFRGAKYTFAAKAPLPEEFTKLL